MVTMIMVTLRMVAAAADDGYGDADNYVSGDSDHNDLVMLTKKKK